MSSKNNPFLSIVDKHSLKALDNEYIKAVLQLETKVRDKWGNTPEIIALLGEFGDLFTTIPDIWLYQVEIIQKPLNPNKFLRQLFSHFYDSHVYFVLRDRSNAYYQLDLPFLKCFEFTFREIICTTAEDDYLDKTVVHNFRYPEYTLTYPHDSLYYIHKFYDEFSDRAIPNEILKLYDRAKIFANEYRNKEDLTWEEKIETLFEWGDDKFAIQTIECELAHHYLDKNLWKAYINFMEKRNVKVMQHTVTRYNRLFLSDNCMQQKYVCEKEKQESNTDFEKLPQLMDYLLEENKKWALLEFYKTPAGGGPLKNIQAQSFTIPISVIDYILESSSMALLQKLFKLCKYFFARHPTPICHQIRISNRFGTSNFSLESIQIKDPATVNLNLLQKYYLTNRIAVYTMNHQLMHSLIIPKLYKCNARFINLTNQYLTTQDFNFLVDSLLVESFLLDNGAICETGTQTPETLDFILSKLPNAYKIKIIFNKKFEIEPNIDFQNLKRNVKLEEFTIGHLNGLFEFDEYLDFILNHACRESFGHSAPEFRLRYGAKVSPSVVDDFDMRLFYFFEDFEEWIPTCSGEWGYDHDLEW